jgi:hypothetical protein
MAADTGRRPNLDQMYTSGVLPPSLDICMTVEFNTFWEQELIIAFLCTALSQPEILNNMLSELRSEMGERDVQLPPVLMD